MAQQLIKPVATASDITQPATVVQRRATASPPSPPGPSPTPATRATHRMLMLRGLTTGEAANLTAYLCGIRVGERPWTVEEINRLLFLRNLHQRDGVADRAR